jgi:4-hydroxyphenylpyruvate dioxygenase
MSSLLGEVLPNAGAERVAPTGFHHLHFWVGNAKQAAHWHRMAMGFHQIAYAGPETGVKDRASYVLAQGDIRLVFSSPLGPDHPIAAFNAAHGDGVRDVAFVVPDVQAAFQAMVQGGAKPLSSPEWHEDAHGKAFVAVVGTYGDTVHTLIELAGYAGPFLPGYVAKEAPGAPTGLGRIDHVVGNVGWNEMAKTASFYAEAFGFHPFLSFDDKDISTEFTALRSVVMASPNEAIKMPINEPAEGKKRSQIEEYIDFWGGPGVQHAALTTANIVHTVQELKSRGVEFLEPPATYYEQLAERLEGLALKEDLAALAKLGILVDRDDKGYLLQLFSKPLTDRPTFFYEIIQRRGSDSFGKGNFRALFESIEAEQARRGTL